MSGEAVHSLGTTAGVLAAMACLVSLVAAKRREGKVRTRGMALLRSGLEVRGRRIDFGRARPWAAPLGVVAVGWFLIGGPAGGAVGLVAAMGVHRWQRDRRQRTDAGAPEADASKEVARQLPLAADLMAACISAGAGPREAAEAVGESLGGPVGGRLARTAAQLRLGAEPAPAWGCFGEIPGAEPLARCLERADSTGAPAAEPVSRLAERFRAERARAVAGRGRRAQVLITAPVGLCFLPAFLAVGVAPVVIGLAGGLLHGN
ncbi:type II secretion system F family protein [Streptomyces sp. OZ13]|uniref:type II secretion system F family protein n=1 Tax=Streptomyces sp. OZ13 TaxID=3452210 RepID=UPI003F8C0801